MSKYNIIHYSLRLNMDNEQHQRINGVLKNLNKSIHKSANQFIANAIDYYINNFGREQITGEAIQKPEECEYVTQEDLRKAKDEMMRLLGAVLASGHVNQMQPVQIMQQEETEYKMEDDAVLQSLVENWG